MASDPRNMIDIPGAPRVTTMPEGTIGYLDGWNVLVGFPFFMPHGTTLAPFTGSDHWLIFDKPVISWVIDVGAGKGTLLIETAYVAAPIVWKPWRAFICTSDPYPNTVEGLYVPGYWMWLTMIAHTALTLTYIVKAQAG